jgi:amino acid transporter
MSDWTTEAVDTVERVVGAVRDKTVEPAQRVTRALVFGLLTSFFIFTALLLVSIAVFRALDVYLPGGVWAAYLVMGGIFVIAGALLWTRRSARPQPGPGAAQGGTP